MRLIIHSQGSITLTPFTPQPQNLHYQSTGVSINIQAELDATLLARPDELQRQAADLYVQGNAYGMSLLTP